MNQGSSCPRELPFHCIGYGRRLTPGRNACRYSVPGLTGISHAELEFTASQRFFCRHRGDLQLFAKQSLER
jgi:hypothetical protein